MRELVVALTTVPGDFDAQALAQDLVTSGLVACVTILPAIVLRAQAPALTLRILPSRRATEWTVGPAMRNDPTRRALELFL